MQSREIETLGLALNYGVSSGIGWFLAILAIAAIREKIRYSAVPPALRGLGITFIITGLMAIGFMSFGGMLTGGDEPVKNEENTAIIEKEIEKEQVDTAEVSLVDNLTKEKNRLMIILAASTIGTVIATVVAFLFVTLLLVALLLTVKQKLSPSGPVKITINGEREIEVASGSTLLNTLKVVIKSFCHLPVGVVVPVFSVNAMFFRVVEKLCQPKRHIFQGKN
jgi:hypothetical protein